MCHIQGDHEIPCLYVQDRCWYVDRTLAFPSSCLLCFEEDLVYHRRGIACRLAVQSSWEFIYPSRRRLFREVLSLLMASKRTWCIIAEESLAGCAVFMGVHLSKSKTALQGGSLTANGFEEDLVYHRLSAGCAVFMGGHLSKSKRVFRRVVASSRNQGVVADSIESFLNYSECEIITVAGLAFRDIDWLISLANHEVIPHS